MTIYTTYFNAPVQIGKAVDNLVGLSYNSHTQQTGYVGDVVLSQLVAPVPLVTTANDAFALLPPGSDLVAIDIVSTNGVIPSAGVIGVLPTQADGSSPGAIQSITLSTTSTNNPIVLGATLNGVYAIPTAWRIVFRCTTNVGGTPNLIANVRYCVRR